MAIRWVSNPESIKTNQPSVLGIAETLAAMGVSVWIAVTWDTYLHIAIGALIAPMLLMRTDESCIRGFVIAERLVKPLETTKLERKFDTLDRKSPAALDKFFMITLLMRVLVSAVVAPLWYPTILLLARVGAWVTNLVQHPVVALAAIPGNWRYATVVLDSKKWPELMPEPSNMPASRTAGLQVGKLLEGLKDATPHRLKQTPWWLLMLALVSLLVVPAFVYRWSLKSTAIIWFPLLWAMHSVREAGKPLSKYFDIYLRDPITKIVLWVSVAAILSFLSKIVLFNVQVDFVDWWNRTPLLRFFSLYVAPDKIQWWQAAMVINSAIAITMYFLARKWSIRIEHDELSDETLPRKLFQTGLFIRRILSCYTIACTLYITIRAASDWSLPELGSKLFPGM